MSLHRPGTGECAGGAGRHGAGEQRHHIAAIKEGTRAAAAEGKAALQAWCAREGVPFMPAVERLDATFATWTEWSGEVERVLTLAGRSPTS